ncbi:hypothetical protein [Enterobacter hormaechei]|uniref:hypothetical protein n=1 Tax=Enterobacter hormaechei TaxID=158836 RepID=UPI00298C0D57|nr:hypothetical protein [Enterobacter hormaechei]MCE1585017.1 hypothetical protein [Enterobacter hormaechei]MCM7218001.1 hypothetical protein [Enterobacter hormaechei]
MKYSYFHHTECTSEQADSLIADYRARGIRTEKSLNPDFLTWTVSARLPVCARLEHTPRSLRQRMWG